MRVKNLLGLFLAFAAITACSLGASDGNPTRGDEVLPSASPTIAFESTPNPPAVASPTEPAVTDEPSAVPPTSALTPVPTVAATARSTDQAQRFWSSVTPEGIYSNEYESLVEIASEVDLVVVGRILYLYTADIQTSDSTWPSIWGHLVIEEVVKGDPVSRVPGAIDIALTSSPSPSSSPTWESARDNVPDEEVILFLMNEAAYRARVGQNPIDPEAERYMYWRPDEQAVLRNVDGSVGVVDAGRLTTDYGKDVFPMTVFGDDFSATLAKIRSVVARE